MFCPKCGNKLTENAAFCINCGFKIPVEETAEKVETAIEAAETKAVETAEVKAEAVEAVVAEKAEPVMETAAVQAEAVQNVISTVPQAAAETLKASNDSVKKGPTGGKKALAVLLCLVGGLFLGIFIFLLSARGMIGKGNIKSLLHKVERQNEDAYDDIMDEIRHAFGPLGDMEGMKGLDDMVASVVSGTLEYAVTGSGDPIDVDAVMQWVEKNKKKIENYTDNDISKDDLKELKTRLNDANKDAKKEIARNDEFKYVQMVFGNTTVLVCGILVLIFFGLVFVLFGRYYDKSLRYVGTTSLVHSIIAVLLSFAGMILMAFVLKDHFYDTYEKIIFNAIFGKYMTTAFVFVIVSIGLIVLGKVLRKSNRAYAQ